MAEPEKPTLFDSIRRYTNTQISGVLHSLIGVPSMLQPPTFSDMDNTPTSDTTSTLSQPTTPSGEGSQQVVEGRGDGKVERVISEEWKIIERQLFLRDPEEVFSSFLKDTGVGLKGSWAEEVFWPRGRFGDVWVRGVCRGGEADVKGKGGEEGERAKATGEGGEGRETELDAYAQLLPLSTRPENKTGGAVTGSRGQGSLGVVSSVATTRSVTENGVTKTEYILKRRFSDGQEEFLQKRITRGSG
ncbi:unnamed protein product [Tuber melanosporum]|jgi:hypothetical protein|uniref:(Perigord truffle) hypothetical protein n=1 Tax=Tuber melanosporum (strain Mel28) TaxID=656061 RepID=D5GP60_TUBMM|nr:uncharacterized protein GSTUM_00011720001 [Tuber melanosporum]CAZ86325.1 unnamed protein product [Tuber melanosporum]